MVEGKRVLVMWMSSSSPMMLGESYLEHIHGCSSAIFFVTPEGLCVLVVSR